MHEDKTSLLYICIQKLWKYVIYLEMSKVKDSSVCHVYQKCH